MPPAGFTHTEMPAFDRTLLPEEPDLSFEGALWKAGLVHVAGIDEAGRGALAGPVAAAAVILPPKAEIAARLKGIRDSKQMTVDRRETGREQILQYAASWGVGFAAAEEIDQMGIIAATRLAASRALEQLIVNPAHLLLDYLFLPENPLPQTALIKGDCRSLSIAAASVLAKTSRDAILGELELVYPGYGFSSHKGYGTQAHREALRRLGISPVHRTSFNLFGKGRSWVEEVQG